MTAHHPGDGCPQPTASTTPVGGSVLRSTHDTARGVLRLWVDRWGPNVDVPRWTLDGATISQVEAEDILAGEREEVEA